MSKDEVSIAHRLERRVRLKIPSLVGKNDSLCEELGRALATAAHHDRVTVRPGTGSVIVESFEGPIDASVLLEQAKGFIASGNWPAAEGEPVRTQPTLPASHATALGRALAQAIDEANAEIRRVLGGHADLATLLPLVMFVAALKNIVASGEIPRIPWGNLFWWSIQSFMTFNRPELREEQMRMEAKDRQATLSGF